MPVMIATMGKFWGQAGYGIRENRAAGVGTFVSEEKRKPVVLIDRVRDEDEKIQVTVIGVKEW
jgi:hypothetical protein